MINTYKSYIIQEGTGDDAELRAYKECFEANGSPKNIDVLKWFHQQNLRNRNSILYALDGESKNIAAIYTYLPAIFTVLGKEVNGLQSFDTLTDNKHRGKGLFVHLETSLAAKEADRGNALIYGFPNENSVHGFVNKLSFSYFGEVPFLIKPLRVSYFLKKLLRRNNEQEDLPCNWTLPDTVSVKEEIELRKINRFDSDYQILWDQCISPHIPIGVSRHTAYMNWRYIAKPGSSYGVYGYYENNRLEGVVVFTLLQKHGGRIGYIMELLYNPSKPEVGRACLKFATKILKKNNTDVILSWCFTHSYNFKAYKKSGFYTLPEKIRPQKLGVIVKVLKSTAEKEILTRSNWYISYSDSDTV